MKMNRILQLFYSFFMWCSAFWSSWVLWCSDSLPPPPGWHYIYATAAPRMSPTPRSAKYGATHSCNPSRGSENVRLRSSSPHRAHHRIALPRAATLAASPCATTRHAAPRCTAPPRSAARASPCRTAPPRHLTMRYRVPHCTTRRQLSPPAAELHCNAV